MEPLRIAGLGEILWDIFPDGPRFGGAPSNFSCSTAELALDAAKVFIASAVGNDPLGNNALTELQTHRVNTVCVQTNDRDTGQVHVKLDQGGSAHYQFAEDSAWDYLQWDESLAQLAGQCNAVCFGTLGQRHSISAKTILRFVDSVSNDALRVLDVNLRYPYVSNTVIENSLSRANVLKLNNEELPRVASLIGATGSELQMMEALANHFRLHTIALTRGPAGAVILSGDELSDLPGVSVDVVDTVGAGDAFTAAMTLGLLRGNSLEKINMGAIAAAAWACVNSGGTMAFPEHIRQKVLGGH
ncbi:MAG: hypothetical protein JNL58_05750 [Planctomyces sp.]|nr:hypothetical protein [Planctomyces sp.]